MCSSSEEDGAIGGDEMEIHDDAYFDRLFEDLARHSGRNGGNNNNSNEEEEEGGGESVKLVDFIEQTVG